MDDLPLTYLKQEQIPGIVLLTIALSRYGVDCLAWEGELLRNELETDFGVELSDLQSDKLQAAIIALTSDFTEQDWKVFETSFHLFCGVHEDFDTVTPLEAEYLVMGLAEFELIKLGDEDGIHYSDEVAAYAGRVFHEYGLVTPPDVAPWALMPVGHGDPVDESEKREALRELYFARREYLLGLMDRVRRTLGN